TGMLELVGARRALDAFDHGHRPVIAGEPADHAAERAPAIQRRRRVIDLDTQRAAALRFEVKAVARRAPGQSRRQRRRAALEVGARAAHRIGIDHDAGVAERTVLVAGRGLDGLVVDAGVGHGDAELLEGGDGAPFEIEHRVGLSKQVRMREIGASGIGDGGHADFALTFSGGGKAFQPSHAGLAQALGVGHDVGLRDGYEVGGIEEFADLDLMLQGKLRQRAGAACEDVLLFVVEVHGSRETQITSSFRNTRASAWTRNLEIVARDSGFALRAPRNDASRHFFAAAARSTKVLPPFILWWSGASLIWITTASASTPRLVTSALVMSRIMQIGRA